MKHKINPSVVRSKKMMTNALLQLMQKKPYNTITVSELIATAQLSRKTFYRNFKSKNEILISYIENLFEEYLAMLTAENIFSEKTTVRLYFEFLQKHLDFFNILLANHLELFLLDVFEKCLFLIDKNYQHSELEHSKSYAYAVAFSAAGFWRIACHWAKNGARESSEEMVLLYMDFNR